MSKKGNNHRLVNGLSLMCLFVLLGFQYEGEAEEIEYKPEFKTEFWL